MRLIQLLTATAGALVLAAPGLLAQNLLLNGDFENTSFTGCDFNQDNASFTAGMANCTAFSTTLGGAGEICVMVGSDCGWGLAAQSGRVKLGIATGGTAFTEVDQFSMDLSSRIVSGNCYAVSFYAQAIITSFSPDVSNVEIGISTSATSFGTLVYSGTPTSTGWTALGASFVAPHDASYLTVRQQAGPDSWTHIDNFELTNTLTISLTGSCPGSVTLNVSGATPGGRVAIARALGTGSYVVPSGFPCAGTVLGLSGSGITLAATLTADAAGDASLTGNVPAAACGRIFVQAIDLRNCCTSKVLGL